MLRWRRERDITVAGGCDSCFPRFEDAPLLPALYSSLKAAGFATPSPIQGQAWPLPVCPSTSGVGCPSRDEILISTQASSVANVIAAAGRPSASWCRRSSCSVRPRRADAVQDAVFLRRDHPPTQAARATRGRARPARPRSWCWPRRASSRRRSRTRRGSSADRSA